jgi:hypothetical protein
VELNEALRYIINPGATAAYEYVRVTHGSKAVQLYRQLDEENKIKAFNAYPYLHVFFNADIYTPSTYISLSNRQLRDIKKALPLPVPNYWHEHCHRVGIMLQSRYQVRREGG